MLLGYVSRLKTRDHEAAQAARPGMGPVRPAGKVAGLCQVQALPAGMLQNCKRAPVNVCSTLPESLEGLMVNHDYI